MESVNTQSPIVVSPDPLAIFDPSREMQTEDNEPEWPVKVFNNFPETSHNSILFQTPTTILDPSEEK